MDEVSKDDLEMMVSAASDLRWMAIVRYIESFYVRGNVEKWAFGQVENSEFLRGSYLTALEILQIPESARKELAGRIKQGER